MESNNVQEGRRIALVACCKSKLGTPAAATDLYVSPLFRMSLAAALRFADRADCYILSAKYGLLTLDRVIAPYEAKLSSLPKPARVEWGLAAVAALANRYTAGVQRELAIFAGADYAAPFLGHAEQHGWKVSLPLGTLSMGGRLSLLSKQEKAFHG